MKKKPSTVIKSERAKYPGYWIRGLGVIILGCIFYGALKYTKNGIERGLDLDPILPPTGSILKSLAIPRVSGSTGILQVRSFIKSQLGKNLWDLEEDSHVIDSQHGPSTTFVNLIFTLKSSPHLDGDRIVLAAHYDSKLIEAEGLGPGISIESLESKFVGASDSAWSCALMLAIGKAIAGGLNKSTHKYNFQLIFFDGEEAVKHWSPSDSLYGSRALASKWSKLPPNHFNSLKRIKLMVLLDLLGTLDATRFYSFHSNGSILDDNFKELIEIETKLFPKPKLSSSYFQKSNQFKSYNGQAIEDDHTPFLPFGVPVLHLIPFPFPSVWHKFSDNIEALDRESCRKLSIIIYEFINNKLGGL